jgi:hypothetical protein
MRTVLNLVTMIRIFAGLLVISACAGVDDRTASTTTGVGVVPGGFCSSECSRGILKLFFDTGRGCPSVPQVITHCDPYACADAQSCVRVCTSDADCSQGFVCELSFLFSAGQCVPNEYVCTDSNTLSGPNDQQIDCLPYRCAHNTCLEFCGSSVDCQYENGYVCDAYQRCVPNTPPPN